MTRRWHRMLFAFVLAGMVAATATSLAQPTYSPLEALRKDNIALRNDLIAVKRARLACQAELGRLELLIDDAVVAGKATALVQDVEAAHPGFTVDPKTGALVAKPPPE